MAAIGARGRFRRPMVRPLHVRAVLQTVIVAPLAGGEARVTRPVLVVKRHRAAPGRLTVTLGGLALENPDDYPRQRGL